VRATTAQFGEQGQAGDSASEHEQRSNKPSLAGRVLGFIGLLFAVLLLRGETSKATDDCAPA
jgi:hypothetical protein